MEQNVGLSSHRPPVRRMAKMRQENLGGDSLLGLQRHSTGSPKVGDSSSVNGLSSLKQYSFNGAHHRSSEEDALDSESISTTEEEEEEERGEEEGVGYSEGESFQQQVYNELSTIRDKMKDQFEKLAAEEEQLTQRTAALETREGKLRERERQLKEREEKVRQMERLACEAHDSLTQCIEEEVTTRMHQCKEEGEEATERLKGALRDKNRENQRLKSSFDTVKLANEGLRKQLQDASERSSHLEVQVASLQSRLTNLQRRNEYNAAKQQQQHQRVGSWGSREAVKPEPQSSKPKTRRKPALGQGYYELVATLMNWLCQVHLSQSRLSPEQTHHTQHCCGKLLPLMADLLPQATSVGSKLHAQLHFLEFVYWAVWHLSPRQQRSTLTSTLRRIGEEVYKPSPLVLATDEELSSSSCPTPAQERQLAPKAFFRSQDLHVRILSTLLILKTLSQVDCLAHAFDALRQDLKEDVGKEVFLSYRGVETVLPFMRPSNKALCSHAVDVYLQLAVESALLPQFLSACACEEWFSASCALLRESKGVELGVLEKLSIVMQRLSKIKANRRLFEVYQLGPVIQEVLRNHADPDNPFLTLNLRSILINLTSK